MITVAPPLSPPLSGYAFCVVLSFCVSSGRLYNYSICLTIILFCFLFFVCTSSVQSRSYKFFGQHLQGYQHPHFSGAIIKVDNIVDYTEQSIRYSNNADVQYQTFST